MEDKIKTIDIDGVEFSFSVNKALRKIVMFTVENVKRGQTQIHLITQEIKRYYFVGNVNAIGKRKA